MCLKPEGRGALPKEKVMVLKREERLNQGSEAPEVARRWMGPSEGINSSEKEHFPPSSEVEGKTHVYVQDL